MQKITPFLWFNNTAEEAMNFYLATFKNAKEIRVTRYGDAGPGPKGSVMSAVFQLEGQDFFALNGGPKYAPTPSISFMVSCETVEEINNLWKNLSDGGKVFMELAQYPFSEKFGWLQDKFGISWQLSLSKFSQKITPFLMYSGAQHGRAEEAIKFYTSLFENSSIDKLDHYGKNEMGTEGTVKHATFTLHGQKFMCIDSGVPHAFTFTPGLSLFVDCPTQDEVDRLWDKFSEGGRIDRCGWLTDKFGVSWQIIPSMLGEMLGDKDPEKAKRVMMAMLQMDKIDSKKLQEAYDSVAS